MSSEESTLTDKSRLLFGSGFVFGVMATLVVLGIVLLSVDTGTGSGALAENAVVTLAAGVFFTAVVGIALYLLAFPQNRLDLLDEGSTVAETDSESSDGDATDDENHGDTGGAADDTDEQKQ